MLLDWYKMTALPTKLVALLPILLFIFADQVSSKGVLYYREPEDNSDGSCPGVPNTMGAWVGEPTLKSEVTNGSLYTAGNEQDQVYSKLVLQ